MTVVFVPGAGGSGSTAWPRQASAMDQVPGPWHFVEPALDGDASPGVGHVSLDDQGPADPSRPTGPPWRPGLARTVDQLESLLGFGGHLVAHSLGAVPALLTAARAPELVRSITLFEPACLGLARGGRAVEAHIAAMDPVLTELQDDVVPDADLAAHFLAVLGAPGDPLAREALAGIGRRLRAWGPPWEQAGPDAVAEVIATVPTLVLTGGWSALYDEVAHALTAAGAQWAVLSGHGHRPQDHGRASDVLRMHWAGS